MRKIIVAAALAVASLSIPAAVQAAAFSTADTEIGTLLDNPAARAVVDTYMPEFSKNPQTEMARPMTLRAIQQYAPDQITDDILNKIDADLAKIPATK